MPGICLAAAAHGDLEALQWLLPDQPGKEAARALQAAVERDNLLVVQYLLNIYRRCELRLEPQLDLTFARPHCLLVLAKAGCRMRQVYPHRVRELVDAWYAFMGLVSWAAASRSAGRAVQSSDGPAGGGVGLLMQLSRIPKELVRKIANDALLGPEEAKYIC